MFGSHMGLLHRGVVLLHKGGKGVGATGPGGGAVLSEGGLELQAAIAVGTAESLGIHRLGVPTNTERELGNAGKFR